ncbi:MAG: glycosyltransferase family 2 protein [Bacteroidota bacterium]|nr:glycosyltransferase family 2 protein [Bacteroidota bacterium]
MKVLNLIWILLQLLIGYNLIMPLILYFIFLIKNKKLIKTSSSVEADFAIIITAYKQTTFLPEVVHSILQLNYSNYHIYVVADNCDISGLHFNSDKISLLKPINVLGSNTRSHFYAINNFKRDHQRLTIVDSDNLVHPEYLNEINKFFDVGFSAVQGVRSPKNLNTTYACLDAARDIYYHFYDGKILFNAGASATLAGSGMAFTTQLYRQSLEQLDVTGAGFDKVLQYQIVKNGSRIAFAEHAIVWDEKTTNSDQLVKQRARWINTWFRYFFYGFKLEKEGWLHFNWNQILFGIILLRPPLFIFLFLSLLFMIINIIIFPVISLMWLAGILIFTLSFFIALHQSKTDKRIYKSLSNIPVFIFYQILSLLKIKNANKYSVATEHVYKKTNENL